ncbi:MAG: PHP domain-containing protein, partial [Acidimicrobiia bacterium]|nr:PHP domain-containing protein [Acidimicrobiia bacterium]
MVSVLDGRDEWRRSLLCPTDMSVDLHTHSRFSDGSDSPTALVNQAKAIGLTAMALTDHDTLGGIGEARRAADGSSLELIPGVEISCEWSPGTLHMVVLFLEPGPGPLQDRLAGLQQARATRNDRIVDRLNDLGIDITVEQVAKEAGAGVAGRPHIAALLVERGVVADMRAAFDEYLGNGRPAYVGRERLSPEESIELARRSGALS